MRHLLFAALAGTVLVTSCTTTEGDSDDNGSSSTASAGTTTGAGGSTSGGSTTTGGGNATGEQGRMVGFTAAHNAVRTPLGLADLSWDDTVAKVAQAYAETLASDNCGFYHSMGDYGENLYWSSGFDPTPDDVTGAWASEVEFYDYESNSCQPNEMCGHYTQIVWDSTERLGCGRAVCANGAEIWVCNYDPPGNWVGQRPY